MAIVRGRIGSERWGPGAPAETVILFGPDSFYDLEAGTTGLSKSSREVGL